MRYSTTMYVIKTPNNLIPIQTKPTSFSNEHTQKLMDFWPKLLLLGIICIALFSLCNKVKSIFSFFPFLSPLHLVLLYLFPMNFHCSFASPELKIGLVELFCSFCMKMFSKSAKTNSWYSVHVICRYFGVSFSRSSVFWRNVPKWLFIQCFFWWGSKWLFCWNNLFSFLNFFSLLCCTFFHLCIVLSEFIKWITAK